MEYSLHPFRFRFGFDLPSGDQAGRVVLPFQRSPLAILILCAMAIAMTIPAFHVFGQAAAGWGKLESLFDLVGALFSTGWLIGWSVGLLIIYGLLAIVTTGRETLILKPGRLEIRVGIPFLFAGVTLDPGRFENFRHTVPRPKSGHSWRGPHLAFEYEGHAMQVGSVLDETEAMHLAARLRELPAAQGDLPDNVGVALQALVAAMPAEPPDAQTPVVEKPASRLTLSSLVLVLANLIPVFGVLLHGWDLGNIMVLFWAESGIIGFYHLLKIAVRHRWLTLLLGPLFAGQFGAFMAIHFLLIYGLFIQGLSGNGPGDSLPEVAQVLVNLWPALLALLLSHGISFMLNFPDRAAVGLLKVRNDMTGPYQRIAIMHVTIIVGGFLSLALGEPLMALILLILLKMTADLRAHRRQHLPPGSH